MKFTQFLVILIGLQQTYLLADEVQFSASPNECISAQKGEACSIAVSLSYPTLKAQQYCLTLNEAQLGCWKVEQLPTYLTITLESEASLILNSADGKFRATTQLQIRYRKATQLRRRVRNPWSLL